MDFTISSAQILAICGLISAIWGVYKIVVELKKPSIELKQEVDDHEIKLNNDHVRLNEIEESNKMLLQCMLVIINHEITGNGIDKMKETRDMLQDYIINK